MKIIEHFTQGKSGDDSLNEDNIVVTPHFIGVLDGCTSFKGFKLKDIPNGRFASRTVGEEIAKLPPDISAKEAIHVLETRFRTLAEGAGKEAGITFTTPETWPATALLLYSKARQEIWRVTDSSFIVDGGTANMKTFPQEDAWCRMRQAVLAAHAARGMTEKQMLDKDPVEAVMAGLIADSLAVFINYPEGPYGFGVITGSAVPEKHIEVFPVPGAKEIIFASDGYPAVFNTLAETEAYLQGVLVRDPLMIREHPQVKGRKTGWVSYDDRAYIRFAP